MSLPSDWEHSQGLGTEAALPPPHVAPPGSWGLCFTRFSSRAGESLHIAATLGVRCPSHLHPPLHSLTPWLDLMSMTLNTVVEKSRAPCAKWPLPTAQDGSPSLGSTRTLERGAGLGAGSWGRILGVGI